MTLSQLWSLFWSLPWQVKAAVLLGLVLLGVAVVTVGRGAARAVDRIAQRRERAAARAQREQARDRHMNAVRDAPQEWVDHALRGREIEMAGELDLSADDAEPAR